MAPRGHAHERLQLVSMHCTLAWSGLGLVLVFWSSLLGHCVSRLGLRPQLLGHVWNLGHVLPSTFDLVFAYNDRTMTESTVEEVHQLPVTGHSGLSPGDSPVPLNPKPSINGFSTGSPDHHFSRGGSLATGYWTR